MLLLVVLLASLGYSIAQAGPSCDAVFAANNINKTDLMLGAGHGIHSITVRDIRYYFDPDFPEDNDIPTVNPDFRGDLIRNSAPLGGDFFTPGMRVMNDIFANDDGTDNYLIQGHTRTEKLAHGMHMLELWSLAGQIYKHIKADPPSTDVCTCVLDGEGYRLTEHLELMSKMLRIWGNQTAVNEYKDEFYNDGSNADETVQDRRAHLSAGVYIGFCYGRSKARFSRQAAKAWPYDPLPWSNATERSITDEEESRINDSADFYALHPLSNPSSWPYWLEMLEDSMITEDQIMLFSTYIYCKKQALDESASQDDD